jgi:flagellar biosynthetic protein FliR
VQVLLAAQTLDSGAFVQTLLLAGLLCARIAPLSWLVPWMAVRGVPAAVSLALTFLLVLCLWPTAASAAPVLPLSAPAIALLALREILIGTVYALALALPLRALEWAGQLMGRFVGERSFEAALGSLQLSLGVAAFFLVGGHRVALRTLADAIVRRPVGMPSALHDFSGVALSSVHLLGDTFASALLIALPVAAALVLTDLALSLTARSVTAPNLPLAFAPVRPAVALLVIALSLVLLLDATPEHFARSLSAARRIWEAL